MEDGMNDSLDGLDFQPVEATPEVNAGALPDPAGATIWPSGLTKGNTKATKAWVALCSELGLDPYKAVAEMGAMKQRKLVQVRAVDELRAKKPVPVRWHGAKSHLVQFHLGGVFEEYPELRPAGRRTAAVTKTTDKKGVPCLVISLQTALPKRVVARSKAGGVVEAPGERLPDEDL